MARSSTLVVAFAALALCAVAVQAAEPVQVTLYSEALVRIQTHSTS